MEKEGYKHFAELTAESLHRAMKENRHVKDMVFPAPSAAAARLRYERLRGCD